MNKVFGWHGTSSLNAIMEIGLNPFPSDRVWEDDENFHIASAGGVYFGEDPIAAAGFSIDAQEKLIGCPGIILAELDPKSVIADEDRLRTPVARILHGTVFDAERECLVHGSDRGLKRIADYIQGANDPEFESLLQKVAVCLGATDEDRSYIVSWLHGWHLHLRECLRSEDIIEAKEAHFRALNILCQRLSHTATREWVYGSGSTYHSFRTLDRVGFEGDNRILGVGRIREANNGLSFEGLDVLYGTFPDGTEEKVYEGWRHALNIRGIEDTPPEGPSP